MKRLLAVLTIAVLSVSVFSSLLTSKASAQTGNEEKITLSPAVEKINFAAGTTKSGKMTVINDGQTSYDFVVYAAPFSVNGEDYKPDFVTVNERTQAYQWISFAQEKYRLEAGQRVVIPYTITVPQNAAGGGHYAVLFAETQPPKDSANVARKKRVGTLLYMSVDGTTQESGSVESLTTQFWRTSPPIVSDVRIRNDGNVHFQADIEFYYATIFGKKQYQLKKESLILPGTTRRIPIAWENTPYFGIFKTGGNVKFLNKTEPLPTKYIVLLPYPILIGIIVAIILVVLWIVLRRRSNRKGVHFAAGKAHRRR